MGKLYLSSVFDQQNAFIRGNELSERVQKSRLTSACTAANKQVAPLQDVVFKAIRECMGEGSAFDEVRDFEVTNVEFANGERHTTQAAGRNDDLWTRKGDVTDQYWTDPYVPGKRLEGKPAFVLTSKNTFSGGEEFTNNLKVLKRATIVGETTGGGAHPVRGHRITEHFGIGVPFARAINPVTHTNWEGTGVEADVKVDASQALEEAIKLATERIKNNAK